jgi:hypothetical protein
LFGKSTAAVMKAGLYLPNSALTLPKMSDLFGIQHVRWHHETVRASLAYLRNCVESGGLVLIVVNGYVDTVVGQFQGDSSANATRAPGDQSMFSVQGHIR